MLLPHATEFLFVGEIQPKRRQRHPALLNGPPVGTFSAPSIGDTANQYTKPWFTDGNKVIKRKRTARRQRRLRPEVVDEKGKRKCEVGEIPDDPDFGSPPGPLADDSTRPSG
jgi:hypothetical protein